MSFSALGSIALFNIAGSSEPGQLGIRKADQSRWLELERPFDRRSGSKACWRLVWCASAPEAKRTDGASRKTAMAKWICGGIPVELLVFEQAGLSAVGRAGRRRYVMRLTVKI